MEDDTESSDLPHVNLVFIGPCGCGKSTLAGRLIADSGAIDTENLKCIFDASSESGKPGRCYAWILDKLKCERDRGNTMFVALWRVASRRCRFTVIDAPGHDDFSKDIVTAMSQADIAVLVVPAFTEDLELGKECEGQLREHTLLAYTLGLRQVVVCVNKMDSETAAYSEDIFDSACRVVRRHLNAAGLKTHDVVFDVHFVPTSGWIGDNAISRSDNMPWYSGPTLVEAIDDAVASHFEPERPLRFPLHQVMKVGGKGTVVVGRVATGSLKCGMRLVFAPGETYTTVGSITMHHKSLEEAVSGDIVNVTVDADTSALRPGMVGAAADDSPSFECKAFVAQVIVLSDPRAGEISSGCVLSVACHNAQVLCVFEDLLSRTDRRTGKILEMMPSALHAGDAAVVRLVPDTPLCVEPFEEYPFLGRFSVHDQKVTVAVGVVQQVEHAHGHSNTAREVVRQAIPTSLAKPVKLAATSRSKTAKSKTGTEAPRKAKDVGREVLCHDERKPGNHPRTSSADSGDGDDCALPPDPCFLPVLLSAEAQGSSSGNGYAATPSAASSVKPAACGVSPFAAFGAVASRPETQVGSDLIVQGTSGSGGSDEQSPS